MTAALLDVDELGAILGQFQRRLFRMERLPEYEVASDGGDFARWLAGEAEPTWSRKQPWLDVLRADRDAGKVRCRVRLFSERLTDYELYACHWGYLLNVQAGEDIRVLRRGEHDIPAGLPAGDWWVVDDDEAIGMHYDKHGRFEAAEVLGPTATERRIDARDLTWAAGEPFHRWWARHPELHRNVAA